VGLTAQQIGHQVIGWVAASNQTLESDTPSSLDHRK
jgi:hypothetical protein